MIDVCRVCGEEKPLDCFGQYVSSKNGKLYRRHVCKECRKVQHKIWCAGQTQQFEEYMSGIACSHCGDDRRAVIDFHHLDPNEKERTISEMQSRYSFARTMQEVAKCIPLCRNCHAILHYNERNGNGEAESL